jgi:excinuclease UvrABC helicase subunit UvrB
MKDFNFNNMDDEEFRKHFMKFINMYQSSLEGFMKNNYDKTNFMNNPFFNIKPLSDEELQKILNSLNDSFSMGGEEPWKNQQNSNFFKKFNYNPYGNDRFEKEDEEVDTLKLLDKKLKESIINEKYEDAAKIRDLINNIKKDREKENNK